ncbi:MAG: glycosyltransferase involved in cell wall biosynthesis [Alphaproteobacteria bacterium]|jgi:glycosyltransferase involved in cell wall biosynthesis
MKIMQVMAGAELGGAETYFVDMVTALHAAGLDQKVVIRTNAQRAATLRRAGIEPVELSFGGLFDLRTRGQLARVIEGYAPDVVQSWMNRATRFVSRPPGAKPFVRVGWFGGYYKVANYTDCDHLVGVTPDIRDHQISGSWPADRAHYIPTFADAALSPTGTREKLRAALDVPDEVPLFLALGRLHEKKAFDVLINAAAKLPGSYVWIAGEGELRGDLERLIASLGLGDRVKLLGWRNDRADLFAASDFCVMPSRYEPFGTVMIESWAQYVPLICARAKGPVGLIKDGEDGLLVPIDDAEALAAAMAQLVDDKVLAGRLAQAGAARFADDFTEQAVVARYKAFYQALTTP